MQGWVNKVKKRNTNTTIRITDPYSDGETLLWVDR